MSCEEELGEDSRGAKLGQQRVEVGHDARDGGSHAVSLSTLLLDGAGHRPVRVRKRDLHGSLVLAGGGRNHDGLNGLLVAGGHCLPFQLNDVP